MQQRRGLPVRLADPVPVPVPSSSEMPCQELLVRMPLGYSQCAQSNSRVNTSTSVNDLKVVECGQGKGFSKPSGPDELKTSSSCFSFFRKGFGKRQLKAQKASDSNRNTGRNGTGVDLEVMSDNAGHFKLYTQTIRRSKRRGKKRNAYKDNYSSFVTKMRENPEDEEVRETSDRVDEEIMQQTFSSAPIPEKREKREQSHRSNEGRVSSNKKRASGTFHGITKKTSTLTPRTKFSFKNDKVMVPLELTGSGRSRSKFVNYVRKGQ